MTNKEKAELMKNTIYQLYSKEGRTKSYISRLLEIDRKVLINMIREWGFPEAEPKRHLTPSNQKFLNKHRNLIKSRLDNDISITAIAKELGVKRDYIQNTIIPYDEVLNKARNDYINRSKLKAAERIEDFKSKSSFEYDPEDLPGEEWKDILGYGGYVVSNKGRVKHYSKRYKSYHLVKSQPNKNNGRLYICLHSGNKRKNLNLARVVAHAFVKGWDEQHNTVNHKDGNVQNCEAFNLEWTSQSENNMHAYRELNRTKVNFKKYKFSRILYKDKYEFKTVEAFARFIKKSPTQARRYMDFPEKHEIKLVK